MIADTLKFPSPHPVIDPQLYGPEQPIVVAGPCSAETRDQVISTALKLREQGVKVLRAGLWKPRTKPGCFEGVGAEGLPWLQEAARLTGMIVATEVATPSHVEAAISAGINLIWIGARTTVNPFAVQELADAIAASPHRDRVGVMVKNPVNADLELWDGAIQRFLGAGISHIAGVLRGFTTYAPSPYRNVPIWPIANELRVRYPSMQFFCDPSHIGGKRELIAPVSQLALDLGFDGLLIESHCDPDNALSDAAQQLTPEQLGEMMHRLVHRHVDSIQDQLEAFRNQIDAIDFEMLELLQRRMLVSEKIGALKKRQLVHVVQPGRFKAMLTERLKAGDIMGLDSDFLKRFFSVIHDESVRRQL